MAKKERSKLQIKLDQFSRALFLDENGKPKSAVFLYSFLTAILYAGVYFAAYLLLIDPLEHAFAAASAWVRNLFQYLVPAIVGSIPCVALYFAFREKKHIVPCAYLWLAVLLVASAIFMLLLVDWQDDGWTEYGLFWVILGIPALLSVVIGGVPVALLYRKDYRIARAKAEADKAIARNRPSYYNT